MAMDNRVALVTGGTGGIGTAICKALADKGARVASCFRNQEKADRWLDQCKQDGYDFHLFKMDVTDFDSCNNVITNIANELGPIDILVNNAGITADTTLRKMQAEQWQAVMRTNLDSVFNTTRNVLDGMLERSYGRIVNISSVNGQKGQLGQCNYASAKAGMHGFTKSLAQEVARKGITVNTVSPGYIATDMVMAMPEKVIDAIVAQVPMARLGKPEEIARLVAFLVDDESAYMTGADFSINGGLHMY